MLVPIPLGHRVVECTEQLQLVVEVVENDQARIGNEQVPDSLEPAWIAVDDPPHK